MNRSTSQNFNFDDAKRGEIKILQDFDTVLEWYLKMEGWISYPDYAMLKVASDADICVGHWSCLKNKED